MNINPPLPRQFVYDQFNFKLITHDGTIYQFYVQELAEAYQRVYGGVLQSINRMFKEE